MYSLIIIQNKKEKDMMIDLILNAMLVDKDFEPLEDLTVKHKGEQKKAFKLTTKVKEAIIAAAFFMEGFNIDGWTITYNEVMKAASDGRGAPLFVTTEKPGGENEPPYQLVFNDSTKPSIYFVNMDSFESDIEPSKSGWSH